MESNTPPVSVDTPAPSQPEVPAVMQKPADETVPEARPLVIEPAKLAQPKQANGAKEPTLTVVLISVVFIALAAIAYYAYSKST